jgi:hypothetical protein
VIRFGRPTIVHAARLAALSAAVAGCGSSPSQARVGASAAAVELGWWEHDSPLGDTWEWDGTSWTEVSVPAGPPARRQHALAFDSARGVTVLFGGADWLFDKLGDTWEWDGSAWTERCTDAACRASAPAARSGHALAYDPNRKTTVVVGGLPSDAYEWDGAGWKLVTTSVPSNEQIGAAAAFDDALGHVELLDDVEKTFLELDGPDFVPHPTPTDPGLAVPTLAMAYDGASGRMVMFGGSDASSNTLDAQTWEWDGAGWTETATGGPSPRSSVALAFDGVKGAVILFGGADDALTPNGETWHYHRKSPDGRACTAGAECVSGACTKNVCCSPACKGGCDASGQCIVTATCDGDHTLISDTGGPATDCAPYACSSDGACKASCTSVDDCAKGSVCDPNGLCVATAAGDSSEASSGCSASRRSPRGAPWIVSAALLALVASRGRSRSKTRRKLG